MSTMSNAQAYRVHVDDIWNSSQLSGLMSKLLFHRALTGFYNLKYEGKIKGSKLILVDFRQTSTNKRLYIIDVKKKKLLWNGYVSHGVRSGRNYAVEFSNKENSWQSSLGFFVTGERYNGKNGPSIKLDGLDEDYNDNARDRNIVIHGANYVDSLAVGHSKGCIAIPIKDIKNVIDVIKEGDCLFIYSNKYTGKTASLRLNEELAKRYYYSEQARKQINELYKLLNE